MEPAPWQFGNLSGIHRRERFWPKFRLIRNTGNQLINCCCTNIKIWQDYRVNGKFTLYGTWTGTGTTRWIVPVRLGSGSVVSYCVSPVPVPVPCSTVWLAISLSPKQQLYTTKQRPCTFLALPYTVFNCSSANSKLWSTEIRTNNWKLNQGHTEVRAEDMLATSGQMTRNRYFNVQMFPAD